MTSVEFNFESEYAMLDVGATSSLVRAGSVRPSVIAFTPSGSMEAISLHWDEPSGAEAALESARRYVRDMQPTAYALITRVAVTNGDLDFHLPIDSSPIANEHLAVCLVANDGTSRAVLYPIRRSQGAVSTGKPVVTEEGVADWCPLGDLWQNPFCIGDVVQFEARDRAVQPGTPLWQNLVELTRLRIHDDQDNANEYMAFLDDLRNGIYLVCGRPDRSSDEVLLKPRTDFNPIGALRVTADRLRILSGAQNSMDEAAAG